MSGFILLVLLARVAYLVFLSPWRLVADEAHYWEWSRRLDWSYYTKGPGVAWVIWASTRLFGDHEWAIRTPTAIASAIMTLAGARVAFDISNRSVLAAWYAALLLTLTPGFVGTAQLLTPDSFYASAWLVSALCAFHAIRQRGATSMLAWLGLGAAIGVGFLFKYTMLLFVPGVIAWLIAIRATLTIPARRRILLGTTVAILALVVTSAPVWVWNAQHHWPTVAHQLGRIHLPGGDESVEWKWSPLWFLSFAGAQIGLLGVIGAWLIWLCIRHTRRLIIPVANDERRAAGISLLLWSAVPIVGGYLALGLFKELQANWAIAGYTTLLVLAGVVLAEVLPVRPERTFPLRAAWHWTLGIGLVASIVIMLGPWFFRLPGVKRVAALQKIERRIGGAADRAAAVDAQRRAFDATPMVICDSYQDASLLAFYLPEHPITYAARHLLGGRPTAYDFFADTDLHDEKLIGRDALLVGASRERWAGALIFASIEPLAATDVYAPKMFRGRVFAGVAMAAAEATGASP